MQKSGGLGDNFPAIELPPPRFEGLLSLGEAFLHRQTQRALFAQTMGYPT